MAHQMEKEQKTPEIMNPDQETENTTMDTELSEEEPSEETEAEPGRKKFRISIHVVLLAAIAVIFLLILYRIMTWGDFISQEEIFSDGPGTYEDNLDNIVPLLDEDGNMASNDYSDGINIVAFGNGPFSDDRDSEDSLANLIAEKTGGTVYNCSVSGSFLAAGHYTTDAEPMDAYTFYWLSVLACGIDINANFEQAAAALGDDIPPEAAEVVRLLNTIDFNTIDAIAIMYDGSDYLAAHSVINAADLSDITTFTGNLVAGIQLFQKYYPHIRIIVMSPAYAFAIDDNGEYISSDVQRYGGEVLSNHCLFEAHECSALNVTFVDNLYGTITEDNAKEYLIDNLHLNLAGRELVAERFAEAFFYFD